MNRIQRTLTGSKISTSSTKFVYFGPIGKKNGRPGFWLAETSSTSSLKSLNGIQLNLTGSKISMSSTKFVFFEPIGKTRWPPWSLIGWDIFDFSYETASEWLRHFRLLLWNHWTDFNETWQEARSKRPLPSLCYWDRSQKTRWPPWPLIGWDIFDFFSEIAERNYTQLDRKQTLNVLYQVFLFFGPIGKNKMAALASDWLRNFRLLWWNRWTEFKETWQKARSQSPLPSLCFSGWSEKQDGRPSFWLAETFSTSSLKPLNGIQQDLTGKKISMSSTKFVFFGPIGKIRWPSWPLIGWDIFDFFSGFAKRNSTKLYKKQDLNVFYQVCVFWADRKNKMSPLPLIGWDIFDFFSETAEKNFDETWQEARSQRPLPSLCFFGPIGKKRWPPWPMIGWYIFDFSSETAERDSKKFDREQDLNIFYQVVFFSLMSK